MLARFNICFITIGLLVFWTNIIYAQTDDADTLYMYESDILFTQDTSLYEIIYAEQDTIREEIEISLCENLNTHNPIIISIGVGIEQLFVSAHDSISEERGRTHTSFPIHAKFQKGNYFIQTGFVYRKNNYIFSKTHKLQKISSSQDTEIIFVDTIYREIQGIFMPEVINREQIVITHDTTLVDSLSSKSGVYSYYSFPFRIGYSNTYNSFSYGLSIGASVSLYSNNSFDELSSIKPYMSRIMSSYIASASCGYAMHKNIVIEGSYSYCFKPNAFAPKQQINNVVISLFYIF